MLLLELTASLHGQSLSDGLALLQKGHRSLADRASTWRGGCTHLPGHAHSWSSDIVLNYTRAYHSAMDGSRVDPNPEAHALQGMVALVRGPRSL